MIVIAAGLLAGCATNDYARYSDGQARIEQARANADAARYKALSEIAAQGDTTAKVAAVIALTAQQGQSRGDVQLQPPPPSTALQWAQILAPSLTNLGMAAINANVAKAQSNNAARVAESTNNAFVGIAGRIQAPAADVTTTTTMTTTTDGRVTDNRVDSSQHTADSGNTTSTWGNNSGANSGNSGRLAGGDATDSTHAPAIVTQPAPVVIPQPAPVIVTQPAPVVVQP